MRLDVVSPEITGCIVLGSPVAPITRRPPATGCSDAAAVAVEEGCPVGVHAVAISIIAAMSAIRSRTARCCLIPLVLLSRARKIRVYGTGCLARRSHADTRPRPQPFARSRRAAKQ